MRHLLSAAFLILMTGCFPFSDDGQSPATVELLEAALAECDIRHKDFAHDRQLDGALVLILHRAEPDLDRKRTCVEAALARSGSYVTSVYPEDINRDSLY